MPDPKPSEYTFTGTITPKGPVVTEIRHISGRIVPLDSPEAQEYKAFASATAAANTTRYPVGTEKEEIQALAHSISTTVDKILANVTDTDVLEDVVDALRDLDELLDEWFDDFKKP
jgi:hypothetical protein